jgi:hypothetical protein
LINITMDARNNIATDLFYKIRSRFSGLKLGAETGEITINPEEARFFDFDYMEGENPIGHVSISLAEPNSMKIYFSHGITENMDIGQKGNWYKFLRELRQFAKRRLLSFDTRDIAKDNLDKRDYAFLSQNAKPKQQDTSVIQKPVGESVMNESAMYGTKTMSFQKLMDTRLIIKHSQAVMDDTQPGARTRHISALFVENQDGERFKYPFIHLAGARAMQRHVANGGLPYDDLGKSIISMSEEIAQLKSFGNYVVRNDLMNSENNSIVERSTSYLNQLRETIAKLSKQSHYEAYKESFQARDQLEVPDEVVEDFTEKFTVRNFKEDIKSVFPVLYRLMQEDNTIGYDDIVAMTTEQETNEDIEIDETEDNLDPFDQFENWVMGLGEQSAIDSENAEEQAQAIKELQELVGQHFPAGVDGTNAIESLKGIIEDPALYQQIKSAAKEDPDTCVRPLIKQWLEQKAPEVLDQLDFGDMTEPEAEPAAEVPAEEPAAEVPAEEPVAQPQEAADNDDEGASADDEDKFHSKLDKLVHKTFGHSSDEEKEKKEGQKLNVQELAEFITSFYDRNTGTFPKGPEGVCTMVGKKFGEQAEQVARKFVERMAPQQTTENNPELSELARIKGLAGIQTEAKSGFNKGDRVRDKETGEEFTVYSLGGPSDNPNVFYLQQPEKSVATRAAHVGQYELVPKKEFKQGEIVKYVGKNTALGDKVIYNYQSRQDPNTHWVDTVLGADSVSADDIEPLEGKTVKMQPGGNDAEYVKKALGVSGEKASEDFDSMTQEAAGSYIWNEVGDDQDKKQLKSMADRVVKMYQHSGEVEASEEEILSALDEIAREFVPQVGKMTNVAPVSQAFFDKFPLKKPEAEYDDDGEEIEDSDFESLRDRMHDTIWHIVKIAAAAEKGDTSSYGYKVHPSKEDVNPELEDIRRLSGISQGIGF